MKNLKDILLVLMTVWLLFPSAAQTKELVEIYTDQSITYNELKVGTSQSPFPGPAANESVVKPLYKIGPISLIEGDIIQATARVRVTNNNSSGINPAFGGSIVMSTYSDEFFYDYDVGDVLPLTRNYCDQSLCPGRVRYFLVGSNCSTDEHHCMYNYNGIVEVSVSSDYYFFVPGRAQSSSNGAKLRIDDVGRLIIVVYR